MSEIPLHSLRQSRHARAGYTPLHNGDPGDNDDRDNGHQRETPAMRAAVRAAAASSSVNRKGKRRERYAVDAEEEETLLGGAVHEDGDFQDDGREAQAARDSSSSVRYTESHCGAFHSAQSAEVGLVA